MNRYDRFPCNGCGACCRRVGIVLDHAKATGTEIDFPYRVDETGRCEMLDENNKCKVYDHRPDICNIDKMIELTGMDKEAAYIATANACNDFMEEDGIKDFIKL